MGNLLYILSSFGDNFLSDRKKTATGETRYKINFIPPTCSRNRYFLFIIEERDTNFQKLTSFMKGLQFLSSQPLNLVLHGHASNIDFRMQ